jgi:type I restriction enzyme S subunit
VTNEEFLSEFGHIAEGPDGTARLRRLILDLAVRGRLVPQDPADEPASVLLEHVAEERERLVMEKKAKKRKVINDVEPDQEPYRVPAGWVWSRLGSLCLPSQYGWTTKAASDGNIRLLRTTDISSGAINWPGVPWCAENPGDSDKYLLAAGDILVSRAGSIGLSVVLRDAPPDMSVFASYLIRFRPVPSGLTNDYARLYLQSPTYWQLVGATSSGTALENINATKLSDLAVAVPPLAEQQRIVARVDELMAICDELEEGQAKATELRAATGRSTLATIVEADRADTEHAVELINNHVRLALSPGTGAAEVVAELRKTILDLAVRGRLVPQDPADEPASVLLERIAEERERLVADRQITRARIATLENRLSSGPVGWEWASLMGICGIVPTPVRIKQSDYLTEGTTPVIDQGKQAIAGYTDDDAAIVPISEPMVIFGDHTRAVKLVAHDFAAGADGIKLLRPLSGINASWLFILIEAAPLSSRGYARHFSRLNKLPFAIPPLAEQRRIVARVDELMAFCDELEEGLLAERRVANDFAESAVSALVAQVA